MKQVSSPQSAAAKALTFHGKRYVFLVAVRVSVPPSVSPPAYYAALRSTSALAETYTGTAVAAGVPSARLRNEKGVVLELRGRQVWGRGLRQFGFANHYDELMRAATPTQRSIHSLP